MSYLLYLVYSSLIAVDPIRAFYIAPDDPLTNLGGLTLIDSLLVHSTRRKDYELALVLVEDSLK